jgi:hypothetical protein
MAMITSQHVLQDVDPFAGDVGCGRVGQAARLDATN